jgi:hypothetical protein
VGHDFVEDLRGPLLHSAKNVEQDPAADPAPGAILRPGPTLARCFPFDTAGAQRAGGQAIAWRAARPPAMEEGKAPDDRLIRVEQDDLAALRAIFQSRQGDGARGEVSRLGSEQSRGATGAQRIFFKTLRILSRPRWIPVWGAKTRASSRQLHWEESEP